MPVVGKDLKKIVDKYPGSIFHRADKPLSFSQDGKLRQTKARLSFFTLAMPNHHIINILRVAVPPSYEDAKKGSSIYMLEEGSALPRGRYLYNDKGKLILEEMGDWKDKENSTFLLLFSCIRKIRHVFWVDTYNEASPKQMFQGKSEIITNKF